MHRCAPIKPQILTAPPSRSDPSTSIATSITSESLEVKVPAVPSEPTVLRVPRKNSEPSFSRAPIEASESCTPVRGYKKEPLVVREPSSTSKSLLARAPRVSNDP